MHFLVRLNWTFLCGTALLGMARAQTFTAEEVGKIRHLWSGRCQYEMCDPDNMKEVGKYQVRLTPEGSKWIWAYYRARGFKKVNPNVDLNAGDPRAKEWNDWIDQKVAFDRYQAWLKATALNRQELGKPGLSAKDFPSANDPGPAPDSLIALAGAPPEFASVVAPRQHRVRFDDGFEVKYQDNTKMRPKYAYYRFAEGVQSFGKEVKGLPEEQLTDLFEKANVNQSVMRVMKSVSMLEGGFESVNTYDTGYVSVGLIQFASLSEGAGSLGRLMLRYRRSNPPAFERDFRKYGIDVNQKSELVAVNLTTGEQAVGPEANSLIISDKRMIAIFQRAGTLSEDFKIAQIQSAREDFYPGTDDVKIQVNGKSLSFKVYEVVRSEAGMATLMDRKVNTGSIQPLGTVVAEMMTQYGFAAPAELAAYEQEVIRRMIYRKDYLSDISLTQPRDISVPASRGGAEKRGKGR
ncbi:MAG: hypothetical protein JST40_01935 [Armatimonadetes bacterium]|nr:hypothetical protein [Armatimonadota bacterium]